jgi:hypothetical protein
MRLWTKATAAAAAIALGMGGAAAHASLIDWTLSNGAFDDGGSFSGTFTFDSVADAITAWDVTTGSPALFGPGAHYSSPGGCVAIFCNDASDNGSGPDFEFAIFIFGSTFSLTNIPMGTPGTVTGLTGSESGAAFSPIGPYPFSRNVIGGTATGVLATPEPAAWALMIGGFGMAGAALRGKRRAGLA